MCGILVVFGPIETSVFLECLRRIQHRGPDAVRVEHRLDGKVTLGFARLAIVAVDDSGMQPITFPSLPTKTLVYNGEIYNHVALTLGAVCDTELDGEAIVRIPMDDASDKLDGVYAAVVVDWETNTVTVLRDRFGVRPLYVSYGPQGQVAFASELKGVPWPATAKQFHPFTRITYKLDPATGLLDLQSVSRGSTSHVPSPVAGLQPDLKAQLYQALVDAVHKRFMTRDPSSEICALCSGGVDSSIVAALLARFQTQATSRRPAGAAHAPAAKPLQLWTITNDTGGTDLPFARKVAAHVGADLNVVTVSFADMVAVADDVVACIESWDPTTWRASSYMWLLCRAIAGTKAAKIVFSGEGADEVAGGYRYLTRAPNAEAFHKECVRLCNHLYQYDVQRADRCISGHGLEGRFPFLDKRFAAMYLDMDARLRFTPHREKQLLRDLVATYDPTLLPHDVLYRPKEAFSDGGSTPSNSWHKAAERFAADFVAALGPAAREAALATMKHCPPTTDEELMLRVKFRTLFPDAPDNLIPQVWRPRFIASTHTSAREWALFLADSLCDRDDEDEEDYWLSAGKPSQAELAATISAAVPENELLVVQDVVDYPEEDGSCWMYPMSVVRGQWGVTPDHVWMWVRNALAARGSTDEESKAHANRVVPSGCSLLTALIHCDSADFDFDLSLYDVFDGPGRSFLPGRFCPVIAVPRRFSSLIRGSA